jgi:hypothetical protein
MADLLQLLRSRPVVVASCALVDEAARGNKRAGLLLHLLGRARYAPGVVVWKDHYLVRLERGQALVSTRDVAAALEVNKRTARRWLAQVPESVGWETRLLLVTDDRVRLVAGGCSRTAQCPTPVPHPVPHPPKAVGNLIIIKDYGRLVTIRRERGTDTDHRMCPTPVPHPSFLYTSDLHVGIHGTPSVASPTVDNSVDNPDLGAGHLELVTRSPSRPGPDAPANLSQGPEQQGREATRGEGDILEGAESAPSIETATAVAAAISTAPAYLLGRDHLNDQERAQVARLADLGVGWAVELLNKHTNPDTEDRRPGAADGGHDGH